MAGSSNFLQFDINKTNMLDDENYSANAAIEDGVTSGVASSALHNKLFYQLTTFVSAFAKVMANAGYVVSDSDYNSLVQVISNFSKTESGIYIAESELYSFKVPGPPYPVNYGNFLTLTDYIPQGARYGVFAIEIHQSDPNSNPVSEVWIKPKGSNGIGQLAAANRSAGQGDRTATLNQCILPVGLLRTIDYKVINPPVTDVEVPEIIIKLQGYIF